MSNWRKNKELAKTQGDPISLTDQSQARETDINVIVAKMGITGAVPGNPHSPMYGDFTQYPSDLRGFLHMARELEHLREQLPKELRGQPVEQLLQLTPEQVVNLLKPPAPPAEPSKE